MNDSASPIKYAQQHLANERTYLAWVRTAISIIGVGFLATSLHFSIGTDRTHFIDLIAIILGIVACLLGIFILLFSTVSYLRKQKDISRGNFTSSARLITFVSISLLFLILIVVGYFLLLSMQPAY